MYKIKGHYREDDGTIEPGTLDVDTKDGAFVCDEIGAIGTLTARHYAEGGGNFSVQITSSVAAWKFVAADGECERIGMPIIA